MTINLTEKRIRILDAASKHELGLVSRPYFSGFERVAWDKNALALAEAGLLTSYVHGGYEITDAGRQALASLQAQEGPADA